MKLKKYIISILFACFILVSYIFNFQPGLEIFDSFKSFVSNILKFVLTIFILIGIFEQWVKKETIEKHLGDNSGGIAFLWAFLLGTTIIGGFYVALPVARSLYKKNARLAIILTLLGAASIARIPMTLFEASFLGVDFTIVRLIVSIPLIIITSLALEKINYEIPGESVENIN
ncbi:MAG: permease [Bacillota bacterium]